MFNWGSNYEKLVVATALWKLHLTSLVGFSETRFANSRRQVYINIHHEFPAIMSCLEDQIMHAIKNTDAKTREKGDQARELKGKFFNVHFLLNLSGLADAYGQFGAVVNVAQMVHLLPHERYEMFMEAVGELDKMAKCLSDHCKCDSLVIPDKKIRCLWPLNHEGKKTLEEKNTIRGIPIISSNGIQVAGLQTQTRRENEQNQINKGIDAETTSDKQLQLLINELHNGLKTEVYDEQSVRIITLTKTILDLSNLSVKLQQVDGGYIKIALTEFPNFMNAIKEIPIRSLLDLPESALEKQYTEFLRRLEKLTVKYKSEELKSLDPKELIKKFFDPADKDRTGIFIRQLS